MLGAQGEWLLGAYSARLHNDRLHCLAEQLFPPPDSCTGLLL